VEFPIVIDVWTVAEARQEELVGVIGDALRHLVLARPGFVSAEIYQGANRGMVAVTIRMRSAADRRALTDDPEVERAYRRMREIATAHASFFHLVESFGASEQGRAGAPPASGS
jgi:hypothetical protein